ncbi:diguanylate cyclase [Sulfitobacter sp. HNIBRBA2951]|uniref:diguanylate cyclase n=1 Tax=Sulfitobacter aquimarinus TaxID=3158557 RepID=UPI0032DE8380
MQGRILIVDGISTNRIVLKVKLAAAFYQVEQAGTLAEAIALIEASAPDLVLTAMNLPDGTAAMLCTKLRSTRATAMLPVLAVANTDNRDARIDTLRAGAIDVMAKPVNETLLLGRVRNMIRAQHQYADWQMREDTTCALGLAEAPAEFVRPSSVSLIGTDASPLQGWVRRLQPHLRARYSVTMLRDAIAGLHKGSPSDAVVLALPHTAAETDDCLRLISAMRASANTRDIALLVIQNTADPARATLALDMGADDVMTAGFDGPEVALRLQVLLHRKRQVAHILNNVRTGLREVMHDPLTGLYNRRYAMPHTAQMIEQSADTNTSFGVILADMDHFKQINDKYGHASGDAVLVETARRFRRAVRDSDMIARMGGEEFLITMPGADIATARSIADRLCHAIGNVPFKIPGAARPVSITVSLGLAMRSPPMHMERDRLETVDTLLNRADKALYRAKMQGRNRVTLSMPHSRPAA